MDGLCQRWGSVPSVVLGEDAVWVTRVSVLQGLEGGGRGG